MLIIFRGCIMMNRKGFISTAALYSFFLVFCMLLILIMTTYTNNRINYKGVKNDAKETAYKDFKAKNRYVDLPSSVINPEPVTPDPGSDPEPIPPETVYGWGQILLDNSNGKTTILDAQNYIKNKETPNFSVAATTNEGMFATEDDLGTSYYFRGAVDNNWVKFGKENGKDIYWRIIRINGDNSVRMIYSGTTPPISSTSIVMTGTGTQIGTGKFNDANTNPAYVGYMYTSNIQHGNSSSSLIKTTIDNWYKRTSLVNADASKISDQIFCTDRTASTSFLGTSEEISGNLNTSTSYYYGGWSNIAYNKNPKLVCASNNDKFTVSTTNGNGALIYPVGLITAEEIAMAGGAYNINNTNYYLYTNQIYFSGSPLSYSALNSAYLRAIMFRIDQNGALSWNCVDEAIGIRPVISLSSMIKLSGDGTYNNPYEVTE